MSFIYSDNVPVGGFCSVDKQCTGSNNSQTCDNGRCRCLNGHVLLDLECIQGFFFQLMYHIIEFVGVFWNKFKYIFFEKNA